MEKLDPFKIKRENLYLTRRKLENQIHLKFENNIYEKRIIISKKVLGVVTQRNLKNFHR